MVSHGRIDGGGPDGVHWQKAVKPQFDDFNGRVVRKYKNYLNANNMFNKEV